jgi:hypothetical protein
MADSSPGWDAIDAALRRKYPGVTPRHYGTLLGWKLGGPDPLDGISVYQRTDHWHYVTYGMSELHTKESSNPNESGWGFEFTFRLARNPAFDVEPPAWVANFLQNLARYVFQSRNPFAAGHHVDLNGPIATEHEDTAIRAITFAEDPELGIIGTPHGRLVFLQVVGITLDEYASIERWDATGLLNVLTPFIPLLVTDLGRGDLSRHASVSAAIDAGVRRDGSSTGSLFVEQASWRTQRGDTILTFGASAAERIARVLAARLPFGRGLAVDGSQGGVRMRPGPQLAVIEQPDGYVEVVVPAAVAADLSHALQPRAGFYPLPSAPGLVIEIVRSHIRDQSGTIVGEIG